MLTCNINCSSHQPSFTNRAESTMKITQNELLFTQKGSRQNIIFFSIHIGSPDNRLHFYEQISTNYTPKAGKYRKIHIEIFSKYDKFQNWDQYRLYINKFCYYLNTNHFQLLQTTSRAGKYRKIHIKIF